jgi:membrane-bound serine protease (ClpP class)
VLLAIVAMTQSLVAPGAAAEGTLAYSTVVAGEIDPSAARELQFAIDDARRRKAAVVIIRLDTPGGLGASMRAMVKTIAAAPMPVIVYVHPSGARADSAGLPLALAADVAAMAPQTNIGSATPVWAGPAPRTRTEARLLEDLRRKATNSAVGLVRSLAEDHHRNADLAERMIRRAENVSALQARRRRLVDVLAPTEQALLRTLDGFTVRGRKAQRLTTAGLQIRRFDNARYDSGVTRDYDASSWWRSLVYVFGVGATIALVLAGVPRGRSSLRRWRRRRRRLRRQRG